MSHSMTDAAALPQDSAAPARITSTDLLRGAREVLILHHGETYRLRLTSNDKLILTK
ncbi:hemin uptake protein HemP [Falsiroseomonas selenitidurans]|uniref:Hemin uptake protein HemP n=1 Tax=Falsiroseomonas selenitidurans TaxID=2716335 RepID=A0ABX1E2J2_9PROT|nr:hemin uptake protein HemP [Falsiroseomonas selenitidurans]NKC29982.1 hemin uptake protein HemP [Falsiroseomonas selenitidurans]